MSSLTCGCDLNVKPFPYFCAEHLREGRAALGLSSTQTMVRSNKPWAGVSETAVAGPGPTRASTLPTDPKERKKYPVASGVLDYFPDALLAVARVSYQGNEQHNPGQPLHWAREKSTDESDTLIRHFLQRGTLDDDGTRHSAKMAWRALAYLQKEIEAEQSAKTE